MSERRYDSDQPRTLAVISSLHGRDNSKGFIFATTADRQEVFLHKSTFRPQELYDEVAAGDGVSFGMIEAPKGLRGHDVRRMTDNERELFEAKIKAIKADTRDTRGNTSRHGQRQSFVDDYTEDRRRYPSPEGHRRRH